MGKLEARTKALFDAVYADPAANEPRSVLADHLQELGDPRGEFIALQLAKLTRKPTAAATRRERTLLAAHQTEWLGPLAGRVNEPNSTWARGFLERATVDATTELPADPRWNTVRSIATVGGYPPRTEVLGAGCFNALTEVATVELQQIGALLDAKRKPPIESLYVFGPNLPRGETKWSPKLLKLVDRIAELPKLTRLSLHIDHYPWEPSSFAWVWASPVVRRVQHLELRVHMPFELAGFLPALAATELETFALTHNYVNFRLGRDPSGAWSQLVVEWTGVTNNAKPLSDVARPIRELPADALTMFRFDHPTARWSKAQLQVITNAVARQTRIKRKR